MSLWTGGGDAVVNGPANDYDNGGEVDGLPCGEASFHRYTHMELVV